MPSFLGREVAFGIIVPAHEMPTPHLMRQLAGGYFARSAEVLRLVGDVLLDPGSRSDTKLVRTLVAADAFDLADPPTSAAIYQV